MLRLVLLLWVCRTNAVWPVKDEEGAKAEALTASKTKRADTKETKEFIFGLELSNNRQLELLVARIVEVWCKSAEADIEEKEHVRGRQSSEFDCLAGAGTKSVGREIWTVAVHRSSHAK